MQSLTSLWSTGRERAPFSSAVRRLTVRFSSRLRLSFVAPLLDSAGCLFPVAAFCAVPLVDLPAATVAGDRGALSEPLSDRLLCSPAFPSLSLSLSPFDGLSSRQVRRSCDGRTSVSSRGLSGTRVESPSVRASPTTADADWTAPRRRLLLGDVTRYWFRRPPVACARTHHTAVTQLGQVDVQFR